MRSIRILIFFLVVLSANQLQAQKRIKISGILMLDTMPLRGATIRLIDNSNDSLVAFKISDGNGFFQLNYVLLDNGAYSLYLSHMATNDSTIKILESDLVELVWHKMITMQRKDFLLKEIIIDASTFPFKIKEDTIIYEASRYMKEDVNRVEDLLKKMEGFKVEGDGQIRYNGKEIGKILIEGEDMTGDRYKILSKNIQANLISKVEVLHNFNDNRLMKEVEYSDRIALNLTLKEEKKNKFNGTADLGFGFPKKGVIDIDVVGIHKKLKSLIFINKNNIGIENNEDIIYYWDEKSGSDQNKSKGTGTKSPIQPFHLPLPDLKKTYTSRNNDFSFSSIESFRVSKYATLKFLTTVGNENKLIEGSFIQKFYFQSEPSWEQNSINYLQSKNLGGGNKISYRIDNRGNRTAVYELSFSMGKRFSFYNAINEGFINDALKEKFTERNSGINFSGIETIRLKSGLILKIDYLSAKPFFNSTIRINSERYAGVFFNMDIGKEHQQNLVKYGNVNQLDISIFGKKKKFSKTWGIHARQENSSYTTDLLYIFNEVPQKLIENKMNFSLLKYYPYASAGYQVSKKMHIELHAATGIAKIFNEGVKNVSSVMFNSKLSLTYKLSALNQLRLETGFSKRPPLMDFFSPPSIIVGNGSIVDGIQIPSFPTSKNIQIGYYRNNLYSGTSFSSFFTADIISRDNSFSIFISPSLVRTSFYTSRQGSHLSSNTNFEKYFYKLKIKSGIRVGLNDARTPERINWVNTVSYFSTVMAQLNMVSNWKGIFNFEGNISSSISSFKFFLSEQGANKIITRTTISLKPKMIITNKINAGIYFARIKNQMQPSFYLCDMQGQWKIGNSLRLNLTAHNLLNNRIFSDKEYNLLGYSEKRYVLAPRYLIVGLQLEF